MKKLIIAFLGLFALATCVQATPFFYDDFTSIEGINLVGDAIHVTDRIRLTPASSYQRGAAWYALQQPIANEFETIFQFQITNLSSPTGADGFAFVIQNDSPSALGGIGGCMGYADYHFPGYPSAPGIPNSLAVEFDTWHNVEYLDGPSNHISVQTRGILANYADHNYSLGNTSVLPINLDDGSVHTVKICYVPDRLTVYIMDDLPYPVLEVPVDLDNVLSLSEGECWIGFTAGTGKLYESHDILSWSFTPEPATLLLLGLGSLALRRKRRAE